MNQRLYQLLNWAQIEGIIYSDEDRPQNILGSKVVGNSRLYQAFFPFAEKVTLVLEEKEKRVSMNQVDEEGFYAALVTGKKEEPYHYEIEEVDGKLRKIKDPYAFSVEVDMKGIQEFFHGVCYELNKLLGSHMDSINGVEGIRFTVWMPQAVRVSVVGEFNHWDGRVCPMSRVEDTDIFTLFIPDLTTDTAYQYEVKLAGDRVVLQEDYFGRTIEEEGRTLSFCFQEEECKWKDIAFLKRKNSRENSLLFYEGTEEELIEIEELEERLSHQGYTHLILPLTNGGKDFFHFSNGFGKKYRMKELVNSLHQAGIGVLLGWDVSGIHGLENRQFSNFYIANLLYIIKEYHLDGVVYGGMARLLYLDYGKQMGEWNPNIYGGNENLAAIEWIKHTNSILKKNCNRILLVANLDAIWPRVTDSLEDDGLGFDYRYDTDFSKEFLSYLESDPYFRSGIHHKITERMLYAYRERFIMAFGVGECKNLWERLPGDDRDKFNTMKLALSYPMFLPGKLLASFRVSVDFGGAFERLIKESYTWNYSLSPLEKEDNRSENFSWINCFRYNDCVVSFTRKAAKGEGTVLIVANFANVAKEDFIIGVPEEGKYRCFFHTQEKSFGGEISLDDTPLYTEEQEWDGWKQSIHMRLEPLSLQAYIYIPYTEEELYEIARKKAEAIRRQLEEEAMNKAKQMKKLSLKDTLALEVEKAQEAIARGSESKRKMESRQKLTKPGSENK